MTTMWAKTVTAVATTSGAFEQLYPAHVAAGTSTVKRRPMSGWLSNISVDADGTNAGLIEVYDGDGADGAADVNTVAAITATQVTAMVAANTARLIWKKNIISGSDQIEMHPSEPVFIAKGLIIRFSNGGATGTVIVNIAGDNFAMYSDAV
jgi:hypothetical protein